jgi:hypothetical protein
MLVATFRSFIENGDMPLKAFEERLQLLVHARFLRSICNEYLELLGHQVKLGPCASLKEIYFVQTLVNKHICNC